MTDFDRDIDALRALVGSERDRGGTAFASLAHALLQAGRPTDAHDVIEAGRAHNPEYATGHLVAGLVDLALAAREPARAAFRRVLQLDPDNRVALRAIAQLYEEDGEPNEALAYLTPLAQIEPEDISLHERMVRLEASREAGAVASELPLGPEDPLQPDPSALLFPEDVVEVPEAEPSMETLADDALAWVQERGQEAVPDLEEADLVTLTMAEVLTRQGQFADAIHIYEQLIQSDPENGALQDARDAVAARMDAAGAPSVEPELPIARPSGAAAPEVRDYFEELLAAQGEAPVLGPELLSEPEPTVSPDSVPVATLGPEPLSVESLAPEAGVIPVAAVAPLAETMEALAPESAPVAELAPQAVPVAELGPDPVPIAELAPDHVDVRSLAPDEFRTKNGGTE